MPKVLVDTSVWIDFLRSGKSSEADVLERLARAGQLCITEIIRVELLSGARNEPEYRELEDRLANVPLLGAPPGFWNQVAYARFRLARMGFQASIPDVCIAVLARAYGCSLLTLDRQFNFIKKAVPLKFYSVR